MALPTTPASSGHFWDEVVDVVNGIKNLKSK
jgi:hypothetical protein